MGFNCIPSKTLGRGAVGVSAVWGTAVPFSAGGDVVQRSESSEVAVRIREARAAGRPCGDDEARLLRLLGRLISGEARAVPRPGTVQVADLEQEGAVVVLRVAARYTRTALDFVPYVRPLLRRALRDYVRLHGHDVRPSHHAQRGSTRWRPLDCVLGSLTSGDAPAARWLEEVEASTPVPSAEEGLVRRQDRDRLLAAVAELEDEHRYIVERHYGLRGYEATSSRELARHLGVSRVSTDGALGRALLRLRELLDDAAPLS